jgi:protein O-GlcNAc transferase
MDLDTLFSEGFRHHIEGRVGPAERAYTEILKLNPRHADALHHLGLIHLESGLVSQAIAEIQSSLSSDARNPNAMANLGYCFNLIGNHARASELCRAALELNPGDDGAWANLGNAQRGLRLFAEARHSYEKALALCPDNPRYVYNLGLTCFDQGEFNQAKGYFQRCLAGAPSIHEAHNNLAACSLKLHDPLDALHQADSAIECNPDYAEAWSNRGNALNDLRRHEEALASYERSIEIKPDSDYLLGKVVHTQMKVCDWTDLERRCQTLKSRLLAGDQASTPLPILGLFDDPPLQQQCAEVYAAGKLGVSSALGPIGKRGSKGKIRVGYFSMDFREHPVAHLMAGLIECHDRNKVEVHGISFGVNTGDAIRKRLERAFDKFLDVRHLSELEIARLSRDLEIDIALDLGGYTEGSRSTIFAHRAAPIQINYLGFPGTMGTPCMDYLISDPALIPTDSQSTYSEKIIYLPNSYQVNDSRRQISDRGLTRQEVNLPGSGFIFCCFNSNWKIVPETLDAWVRIVQSVPNSILWLYEDNPAARRNLVAEAGKRGLHSNRLVFAGRMPHAEHLARYRLADLFLDTFPYGAHTTASDALWAGLPILTRAGESFASRVASSLLSATGIPELITHSVEKYESLAIELANKPEQITAIKKRLVDNRSVCPLFDTPLFARHIESAFRIAYDRFHAGLPPEHIRVSPQ